MTLMLLLLTGAIIGLVSSSLGIGGGSIMVPVLYGLFPKMRAIEVISISLFVIYNVTFLNSILFYFQKLTPKGAQLLFLLASCGIGGFVGGEFVQELSIYTVKLMFTITLVIILLKTIFFGNLSNYGVESFPDRNWKLNSKLVLTGFTGGLISGLTGLGGGIIFIPMFMFFCKLPTKNISPYSNVAMCISAIMGAIPHILTGPDYIDWSTGKLGALDMSIAMVLVFGSIFFTFKGAKWNSSVSAPKKKKILIGLLTVLTIKMSYSLIF